MAVGAKTHIAVGVGIEQRHLADVIVIKFDAEHCGVRLDIAPSRHAAGGARQKLASRMQLAIDAHDIFAQENLMRGVRTVCLALIDERCDGVGGVVAVDLRSPRQRHDV